jgi:hypothetical protein
VIPKRILDILAPRPAPFNLHRELFPRYTGLPFDPVTPGADGGRRHDYGATQSRTRGAARVASGLRPEAAIVRLCARSVDYDRVR